VSAVASRLAAVRRRIAAACERAGRAGDEVVLVGVGKTHPAALLQEAYDAGLTVFGENRVQEALAKSREMSAGSAGPAGIEWHLIGPLQTNKVRAALSLFSTIHSIDRLELAAAVEAEAARRGISVRGFVEVNLGGEESKHGFPPRGLAESIRPLAGFEHLRIAGLMAIPPPGAPGDTPESSRPWFRQLRALRDELRRLPEWAGFPGWLSMGMSDDFEVAIEEGATHVRVGTAIFGRRD
jgi:pyridoxal phosphate enzyme (YggS family)